MVEMIKENSYAKMQLLLFHISIELKLLLNLKVFSQSTLLKNMMMKANVTETKEYKGSKQPKEGQEIKIEILVVPRNDLIWNVYNQDLSAVCIVLSHWNHVCIMIRERSSITSAK